MLEKMRGLHQEMALMPALNRFSTFLQDKGKPGLQAWIASQGRIDEDAEDISDLLAAERGKVRWNARPGPSNLERTLVPALQTLQVRLMREESVQRLRALGDPGLRDMYVIRSVAEPPGTGQADGEKRRHELALVLEHMAAWRRGQGQDERWSMARLRSGEHLSYEDPTVQDFISAVEDVSTPHHALAVLTSGSVAQLVEDAVALLRGVEPLDIPPAAPPYMPATPSPRPAASSSSSNPESPLPPGPAG